MHCCHRRGFRRPGAATATAAGLLLPPAYCCRQPAAAGLVLRWLDPCWPSTARLTVRFRRRCCAGLQEELEAYSPHLAQLPALVSRGCQVLRACLGCTEDRACVHLKEMAGAAQCISFGWACLPCVAQVGATRRKPSYSHPSKPAVGHLTPLVSPIARRLWPTRRRRWLPPGARWPRCASKPTCR